jgi:hypothetical protein
MIERMGAGQMPKASGGEESRMELASYRNVLEQAYERQSEAYDKTVVALSGGALGVSITFIHEIVQSPLPGTLFLLGFAWSGFTASILASLVSLLTSQWALRKAISQVDSETIHDERPGAWHSQLTSVFNFTACLMFILGVAFLVWFCLKNFALIPHGQEHRIV